MSRRLLPSGDAALLVECDTLDEVLALHDALAAEPPAGVLELVPAARTILVSVDPERLPLESAATWVRRIPADSAARRSRLEAGVAATSVAATAIDEAVVDEVIVDVVYDGDDLRHTAGLLGVSAESLVARHQAAAWRVAFIGFAPGFGYLVSDDWPFEVPRLDAPRPRVPPGAVALAGAFAGVYPRQSPGGWRVIGRTDAVLWDPASPSPALFVPGRRVRFRAVDRA
ncbi:allophanate hydrolase [Agromyces badenianii]|uniref:Allophanate hydrolase n=1 Tax=Agromyces badenianii TaxID=2080742 RepID=A0A2S0WY41_9MICO|nr:allophanate hydrolase subunit 1 [Agromyces badenianii]AWB96221.1 allophanate hydrolase [Agromyces badenianii]